MSQGTKTSVDTSFQEELVLDRKQELLLKTPNSSKKSRLADFSSRICSLALSREKAKPENALFKGCYLFCIPTYMQLNLIGSIWFVIIACSYSYLTQIRTELQKEEGEYRCFQDIVLQIIEGN